MNSNPQKARINKNTLDSKLNADKIGAQPGDKIVFDDDMPYNSREKDKNSKKKYEYI